MSKITKKQILKMCKVINNQIEDINFGGCGVFAYLMGTALNKFENCEARVRIVNYRNKPKKEINSLVPKDKSDPTNWNKKGVRFNHIILEIKLNGKVFLIDSNGLYEDSDKIIEGSIPVHFIKRVVSRPKGWNDWFDRNLIPHMAKLIRKFTKELGEGVSSLSVSGWVLR